MSTDTIIDKTTAEAPEWEFQEHPNEVNMDRLWAELRGLPAVFAYSYLGQLRDKAPQTYCRLREIRIAAGCTVFAWPVRSAPPSPPQPPR